jgi:hypothetical protein
VVPYWNDADAFPEVAEDESDTNASVAILGFVMLIVYD